SETIVLFMCLFKKCSLTLPVGIKCNGEFIGLSDVASINQEFVVCFSGWIVKLCFRMFLHCVEDLLQCGQGRTRLGFDTGGIVVTNGRVEHPDCRSNTGARRDHS